MLNLKYCSLLFFQHRKHKKIQKREEPGKSLVAVHVPRGIHVNEESYSADGQDHHRRQPVHPESPVRAETPDVYPRQEHVKNLRPLALDARKPQKRPETQAKGNKHDRGPEHSHRLVAHPAAEEHVHHAAYKRHQRDKPDMSVNPFQR